MDENFTANSFEDKLPSVDYAMVTISVVLLLASMAFLIPLISMIQMIPSQKVSIRTSDKGSDNLIEDSGQAILLASTPETKPSALKKPPRKLSKPKFNIRNPRFNFPPFKGKKGEHAYHPIINKASEQHDIDPALVKAVIMAESSYNPRAVSPKGAVGLMQLMPTTAESLGVANSFNPEQNVQGGTKYLKKLIDQFDGDIKLALAAYNAGPAHVRKHNGVPPFKDTIFYVHKVYHYYDFYKNQDIVQVRRNVQRDQNKMLDDVDEA